MSIPDHLDAVSIDSAFVGQVADASATVEVPVVIVTKTFAFHADTLSGKNIPLFIFVLAILHVPEAWAVVVCVTAFSVDKRTRWTHDQVFIVVTTRFQFARNDSDSMLDFCLCKISTNLLFHSFKG